MDTTFDRDTAVRRVPIQDSAVSKDGSAVATATTTARFDADVSPDWRAGRGPHGGYLAAMLLRALTETVADPLRAPRSLTIHYARAPVPGSVSIATTIERAGRSLSTTTRSPSSGATVAMDTFSAPP